MTREKLKAIYDLPLFELLQQARETHKKHWPDAKVQLCTLMSIKTGGCSEDCSYCAQSSHHSTGVESEQLVERDTVMEHARAAKENGSTRFCMGAAWRGVRKGTPKFEQVLDIVRDVATLGLEVCVTLGELGPEEAAELRAAGVTSYNHNVDTSPEHYPNIVTTHSFEDRLRTIRHVQDAGMSVCTGGILGLGETIGDRLRMIEVLSNLDPPPESVPINRLMPMPGTPLEGADPVDVFEIIRMIAVARIAMPTTKVRLAAGRTELSEEAQTLCFFAGANSIFYGEKLLTAGNPSTERDMALLAKLGLAPLAPKPL
jgi:biotin synthase